MILFGFFGPASVGLLATAHDLDGDSSGVEVYETIRSPLATTEKDWKNDKEIVPHAIQRICSMPMLCRTFLCLALLALLSPAPLHAAETQATPTADSASKAAALTDAEKAEMKALHEKIKAKREHLKVEREKIKVLRDKLKPEADQLKADTEKMKVLRDKARSQREAQGAAHEARAAKIKDKIEAHKAVKDSPQAPSDTKENE